MALDSIQPVSSAGSQPQHSLPAAAPATSPQPAAPGDRLSLTAPPAKEESKAMIGLEHAFNRFKLAMVMPVLAPDRVVTGYVVAAPDLEGHGDGDYNIDL